MKEVHEVTAKHAELFTSYLFGWVDGHANKPAKPLQSFTDTSGDTSFRLVFGVGTGSPAIARSLPLPDPRTLDRSVCVKSP